MKKILPVIVLLVSSQFINSTTIDSLTARAAKAITLVSGISGKIELNESYQTLLELAQKGHPMSMNAVGRLCFEGKVCAIDTMAGLNWLGRAGDAGYYAAWHNLGTIYKYGRAGVKQDFRLAYYYFEKIAQSPNSMKHLGQYDAGYMLYKGLGCTQDYNKAYTYFKESAKADFVPSMYMLALCYRNGYGVDQNTGEAGYWISQAAKEGYTPAIDEYYATGPENTLVRSKLRSAPISNIPEQYREVPHLRQVEVNQLDGDYEGVLVTYDWSGKVVIKETTLSLSIKTNHRTVLAEWRELGADTVTVAAEWCDSSLVFKDAIQGRQGHYDGNDKRQWTFTNARLQILQDDTSSCLAGNLQMYSPESMEPNQPMYISLHKVSKTGIKTNGKQELNVYPNPFENGLNISFNQLKESEVKIAVFTTNGVRVYLESLGVLSEGRQDITLSLQLNPGVYKLNVITGVKTYQSIVVRK